MTTVTACKLGSEYMGLFHTYRLHFSACSPFWSTKWFFLARRPFNLAREHTCCLDLLMECDVISKGMPAVKRIEAQKIGHQSKVTILEDACKDFEDITRPRGAVKRC